ncbi:cytosolic endo-beta-N-acetylglucosaminidase-like [Hermetia illucens]|nr:cytosolic endo-beta-N-acetylglucosaminidase-like [Hermetia illucens]
MHMQCYHKLNELVTLEMASIEEVLEARAIVTNDQLLWFQVPSRDINWKDLISPVKHRGGGRNLGEHFKRMNLGKNESTSNSSVVPRVLVCHDMMGNYRGDKYYSSSKKWDDYRFYHWAGIDYFCYFSHHYISVPPAGWINAAHKHGVIVLGTFDVEGGNCHIIQDILQSQHRIDRTVDALVRLCDHFCFEGYLLNIECNLNPDLASNLHYFIENLTNRIHSTIPHGTVILYDSLTKSGSLHHQNELNFRNKPFFELCDGILINYHWFDRSLQTTAETIRQSFQGQEHKAFIGIDVFGRSQPAKFETYKLLQAIVPYGFSVGLFAAGWTFESLKANYDILQEEGDVRVNEEFLRTNDKFYSLIWPFLSTKSYTEMPFYSNFCLGSGLYQFGYGNRVGGRFFNLSKQALQPSVPLFGLCERNFEEGLNGGSSLSIKKANEIIPLFCTEFKVSKSFIFAFASKVLDETAELECVLQFFPEGYNSTTFQIVCGRRKFGGEGSQLLLPAIEREQSYKVAQYMAQSFTQIKIPFTLGNGWNVQYFIANFNKAAVVTDIGVVLRSAKETDAYLGAVHFHAADVGVDDFAMIRIS